MTACIPPQERNWATGRCKKPAEPHEGVNPFTKKPVTKTHLWAMHFKGELSKDQLRSALKDDGITRRYGATRTLKLPEYTFPSYSKSTSPRRGRYDTGTLFPEFSDSATSKNDLYDYDYDYDEYEYDDYDDYEPDYRRYRYVYRKDIPSTHNDRLRALDYNMYASDEEDEDAGNIKWSPSTNETKETHEDNKVLVKLINSSKLNVADLRTLRAAQLTTLDNKSGKFGSRELIGYYEPSERRRCDQKSIVDHMKSFLKNNSSKINRCGFDEMEWKKRESISEDNLQSKFEEAKDKFVIRTGKDVAPSTFEDFVQIIIDDSLIKKNVKFLLITNVGVWRILIPSSKVKVEVGDYDIDKKIFENSKNIFDLAKTIDTKFKEKVSVSFHMFDTQTGM